jgi:hypothetical protein
MRKGKDMTEKVLRKQLAEAERRKDKLVRQTHNKIQMINVLNGYISNCRKALGLPEETTKGETINEPTKA